MDSEAGALISGIAMLFVFGVIFPSAFSFVDISTNADSGLSDITTSLSNLITEGITIPVPLLEDFQLKPLYFFPNAFENYIADGLINYGAFYPSEIGLFILLITFSLIIYGLFKIFSGYL